jgi:predicted MFS family arabinose efflux permease
MGTSLPLLNDNFRSPAGRARAFGAFGATLAAATAVGPLVGGLLVAGPGWRWIFLLNLPIGALALFGTFGLVESRSATARRADWAGTVLFTTGLVALVLGLIRGNPDGWDAPRVLALLAVGAAALVAFVIREAVAAEPMLDLTLLRRRGYVGVLLGAFAMGASLIAATSYIALYLANGLGYGPLGVGLRFLPLTLAACVAALLAGELLTRFPLAWLIAGSLGLVAVGMFGLTRVDASSGYLPLAGWFIPAGLGFGASGAVLSAGALAGAVPAKAGMASGVMNTMRQVGLAAGVAGLGAVFQHVATGRAEQLAGAAGAPAPVTSALARAIGDGAGIRAAGALSGPLHQVALVAGRSATAEALSRVAWIGGGLAAACAVLVLVLMPWGRAAR